jgi:hypothetical protein
MSCGGGHLGFPIGIKNKNLVKDIPSSLDGPLQTLRFCSGIKFKMAATAGLSLTLDPMGKMFQNASSLKPILYRNKKRKVCRGPSNEHSCTVWL